MKTIQNIKSVTDLKDIAIAKPRSIPVNQRSYKTELYMLRKEKLRYVKEVEKLKKRFDFIKERLNRIDNEMLVIVDLIKKEVHEVEEEAAKTVVSLETPGKATWKRRKLKY